MNLPNSKDRGSSRVIPLKGEQLQQEVMNTATPFDNDQPQVYTWKYIASRLGLASNVANARWYPKLIALFTPLDAPDLTNDKGKVTRFGAQMVWRYKHFCVDGQMSFETFTEQVNSAFAATFETQSVNSAVTTEIIPVTGDVIVSPLTVMSREIVSSGDTLEGKILHVLQVRQDAKTALNQYEQLTTKSREQLIIEDELNKIQAEELAKKEELELRLKVRQMVQGMSSSEPSPSSVS